MSDIITLQTLDITSYISFKAAELKWDREIVRKAINDVVAHYSSIVPTDEKQLKEIKADINNKIKLATGFAIEIERSSKEQITLFRTELKEDLQPLENLATLLTAQCNEIEQARLDKRKIELDNMKSELLQSLNINENIDLSKFEMNTTWFNRTAKDDKVKDEMKLLLQQIKLEHDNLILQNKARSELVDKLNLKYGITLIAENLPFNRYTDEQVEEYYIQAIEKQKKAREDAIKIAEMKKIQTQQEQSKPLEHSISTSIEQPIEVEIPDEPTVQVHNNEYVVIAKLDKNSATFAIDLKMLTGFLKTKNIKFEVQE